MAITRQETRIFGELIMNKLQQAVADQLRDDLPEFSPGDTVSVGGKVFATGKFLIDNLYDYNGIQVSGTHMVKEDGKWT